MSAAAALGEAAAAAASAPYELQLLHGRTDEELPVYFARTPSSGNAPAPHVCSTNGGAYKLRVVNNSGERIAVKIKVDGQPTQPPGACFIVRGGKKRDLPGFQQKRVFDGNGNFKHEYADFVFGRPDLEEDGAAAAAAEAAAGGAAKEIGVIQMDVHRAVAMACPGESLTSAATKRQSVSAEKKEAVFSSLTRPGAVHKEAPKRVQSWFRDGEFLQTVKVYYKETHALGIAHPARTLENGR